MKKINIVGLTLGDPFSDESRSGVNANVFSRLAKSDKCNLIDVFDLDLKGINKYYSAFTNFSLDRSTWGAKLHNNPWAFNVRSKMAEGIIKNIKMDIDLIYQDGAMFKPGINHDIPFVSYHDCNIALSSKGGQYAHGSHYKGKGLDETFTQEKNLYQDAKVIFTMSDWLKNSLVEDFDINEAKIKTVYAGTNLKIKEFEKKYDGKTILFVGKNFERKGGNVLLDAFKIVKKEIRNARLLIVGPNININEDGVDVKGHIRSKHELEEYFTHASLFVLPSLFEPFGIVFAEAFSYKLPCIGNDICAMPEIIEEDKGGYLVTPNDPSQLADRMITILKDEGLARSMGAFGFNKARNVFNWDVVVDKMIKEL